jgi:hypothetical protein
MSVVDTPWYVRRCRSDIILAVLVLILVLVISFGPTEPTAVQTFAIARFILTVTEHRTN